MSSDKKRDRDRNRYSHKHRDGGREGEGGDSTWIVIDTSFMGIY